MSLIPGITDIPIINNRHTSNKIQDKKDTLRVFYAILESYRVDLECDETSYTDNGHDPGDENGVSDDFIPAKEAGYYMQYGTSGNDRIKATGGSHISYGGAGNDIIEARGGTHRNYGGAGNDIFYSSGGEKTNYGGIGDDVIKANGGGQVNYGGEGNDLIDSSGGGQTNYGGSGDDVIKASGGTQISYGGEGNDILEALGGHNEIYGGDGNDIIKTMGGHSTIRGGAGDDIINIAVASAAIHFNAGDGTDTIFGGMSLDTLVFGGGLTRENARYELKGDDLTISFEGADDKVVLKDWHMESSPAMKFSDGTILKGSDIKKLVQ